MMGDKQVGPAPRNRRDWVVICYDIPDDKRRTKVMKTLEGYGRRAQYSVFECELRPADLIALKAQLHDLIEPRQDDVRFYPLCSDCLAKVEMLGKAVVHRQAPYKVV